MKTGKAWMMSAARMMPSLRMCGTPRVPPKNPDTTPSSTPPKNAIVVDTRAIVRSMRGADITRLKMSMLETSVPNGCCQEGGCRVSPGSAISGGYGAIAGPNRARNRLTATISRPIWKAGRARVNSRTLRHARRRAACPVTICTGCAARVGEVSVT